MRTFVCCDYQIYTFWNIELHGESYTVQAGKVGGKGKSITREFKDATKAEISTEKAIRKKLTEGYIETTSSATNDPQQQAFKQAILTDPRALHICSLC